MRIFATILALALTVLPANVGFAAAKPAPDCPHQAATVPAPGLDHTRHKPAGSSAGPALCCMLHGFAFAADLAEPTRQPLDRGSVSRDAEAGFEGIAVEPALPPPRA